MEKRCNTLRFGESWEKLEVMRELEEIAKDCRTKANEILANCAAPAEREKHKPWRAFRKLTGFQLFNLVMDIAQEQSGTRLRDLAADILAHLWHPAAVDRLVEDLLDNGATLLTSQYIGIFENLAGISNEPAVQALIKLWEEGYKYDTVWAIGACLSKTGEAFLLRQAREHKDPSLRGYCICALNSELSEEKSAFLLDKLKNGTPFEQSGAVRKIGDMGLSSLSPTLMAVYNQSEDVILKEEIFDTLRYMRKTRQKSI